MDIETLMRKMESKINELWAENKSLKQRIKDLEKWIADKSFITGLEFEEDWAIKKREELLNK